MKPSGARPDQGSGSARGTGSRLARIGFEVGLAFVALCWSALLVRTVLDGLGSPFVAVVLLGFPIALIATALIGLGPDSRMRNLITAAAPLALVLAAIVPAVIANPIVAAGPPALLLAAALAYRHPALTVVSLFAISCTFGSIKIYTGISPALIADLLLCGLWLALLFGLLGRRYGPLRRLPIPLWLLVGYLLLTAYAVIAATDPLFGFAAFRAAPWYMMAILVIALSPWEPAVYRRIAVGVVAVCSLVCAYAVLRWAIGPADVERDLAIDTAGAFNFVDGRLRVFGSTAGGHQLGLWAGCAVPICLAAAGALRGRLRLLGLAGFVLATLALLASEVRGAFVGAVVASVVVLILLGVAGGLPRPRMPLIASLVAGLLLVGGIALALTAGSTGTGERYTELLDPGSDSAYRSRVFKWDAAFRELGDSLVGQGLGTGGNVQREYGVFINAGSRGLDNSYVKIAFEQGVPVLALFVVTLLTLGLSGARNAILAVSSTGVLIALAGVGALTSFAVAIYTGLYIEDMISLVCWIPVGVGVGYALAIAPAASPAVDAALRAPPRGHGAAAQPLASGG